MFSDHDEIKLARHKHKENRKICWEQLETEQTFLKQYMDQRASCKGNKKYIKQKESENAA